MCYKRTMKEEDCQFTIIKKNVHELFLGFGGITFFSETVAVFCLYIIRADYLACTIFMDNTARIANILHMGSVNAS